MCVQAFLISILFAMLAFKNIFVIKINNNKNDGATIRGTHFGILQSCGFKSSFIVGGDKHLVARLALITQTIHNSETRNEKLLDHYSNVYYNSRYRALAHCVLEFLAQFSQCIPYFELVGVEGESSEESMAVWDGLTTLVYISHSWVP